MSRAGRLVGGALAVLIAALALALPFLDRPPVETPGSAASARPQGRRAALLLLERVGVDAQMWRQRPGLLPRGRHVLWLSRAPVDPVAAARQADPDAPREERAERPPSPGPDPLELAREAGLTGLRHYRGFVEQGGTLLLPLREDTRQFLLETLSLDELGGLHLASDVRVTDRALLFGELELRVRWDHAVLDDRLHPGLPREVLLRDLEGRPLALHVPVGRGGVVVLSSDAWADNARLAEADHALLLVRLMEGLARGGRVLLDDHALGRGPAESAWTLALAPAVRPLTLHLLALLLLLAWRAVWSREFPRDPELLEGHAPASRARGFAALALRTGRARLLADALRTATLERLLPRARRAGTLPDEELERELAALAAPAGARQELPRWREVLRGEGPADAAQLARLDRDLREIEERVQAGLAGTARGRKLEEARA